jgi:hypothetical protein
VGLTEVAVATRGAASRRRVARSRPHPYRKVALFAEYVLIPTRGQVADEINRSHGMRGLLMAQQYKYKFVRLLLDDFEQYRDVVEFNAREGWRLVQLFSHRQVLLVLQRILTSYWKNQLNDRLNNYQSWSHLRDSAAL